jgi:UMF1 family MFS transporter
VNEAHLPSEQARHRRAWLWYDWANHGYITPALTVLVQPYFTSVAWKAACPDLAAGAVCAARLHVLGMPISPGSLTNYSLTISTIITAIVVVLVGAVADRFPAPAWLLGAFAWLGALAASLMFFVAGTNWMLGVALLIIANVSLGASLVVYNGLLPRIYPPDDRDRMSSRGWSRGYLGGGLLLAAVVTLLFVAPRIGLDTGVASRIGLLAAGLWWGLFAFVPVLGLRTLRGAAAPAGRQSTLSVRGTIGQLVSTFRELRHFPQTLLFLLAYLFFNDGIQTVVSEASLYGSAELKFSLSQVIMVFLLVQFVAFGGALLLGRLALRYGAWRVILTSLGLWGVVVIVAFFLPARVLWMFAALAVLIGIVLGGCQALSRSLYSQLIPRGRESEFFSLYQIMERGTSWTGTLVFGLVFQFAGSYRWSIIALIVYFGIGGFLLSRVRVREGILAAGNELPAVV